MSDGVGSYSNMYDGGERDGGLTERPGATVAYGPECLGQHVHLLEVNQTVQASSIPLVCEGHVW